MSEFMRQDDVIHILFRLSMSHSSWEVLLLVLLDGMCDVPLSDIIIHNYLP